MKNASSHLGEFISKKHWRARTSACAVRAWKYENYGFSWFLAIFRWNHAASNPIKDATKLQTPPNIVILGGFTISKYILKEWSYGHDILYPCRTRLTGCSEEKMKFIGRLENFLDDFEKKVSKQNLGFHRPSIEYSGLIGASFSKNRRKCVSPAIKSFWWVGWYFYYYQ